MKNALIFLLFLIAACDKPTYSGIPIIPDLKEETFLETFKTPQEITKTDTVYHFSDCVHKIVKGDYVRTGYFWANPDLLMIEWLDNGEIELFRPTLSIMIFVKLKSEQQEFWVKFE